LTAGEKLYDIQPVVADRGRPVLSSKLTKKTALPLILQEEEQLKETLRPENPSHVFQDKFNKSVDLIENSFLNLFDEVAKNQQNMTPQIPNLISSSSLCDSESLASAQVADILSLNRFDSGKSVRDGECHVEIQSELLQSQKDQPVRDVAQIEKEIDHWEFKLFKAERRYTDTKLTTVYRVAKMAHALFSAVALLTGFGGLPFFAISFGVKVAVRGLGYAKTWWRKTRPTTEESFRAFKIAREAIKSKAAPSVLAIA